MKDRNQDLQIKELCLDATDQTRFAEWSQDRNPMHLDPLAARRTHAGAPVVHGIHLLLRTLEEVYVAAPQAMGHNHVRVEFKRYVFVSQPVSVHVRESARGLTAEARTESGAALVIKFSAERTSPPPDMPDDLPAIGDSEHPAEVDIRDMAHCQGRLIPSTLQIAEAFPKLTEKWTARGVAALGQTSRLVGMICPGLHSIYSALEFTLDREDPSRGLGFLVQSMDERTKLVTIAVRGSGIAGSVTAFVRPKPVSMPAISVLARRVDPAAFSSRRALVVGGSRGLGEATAKLIAAGGGRVDITYASGKTDAQKVADEINAFRNESICRTYRLDVNGDVSAQLEGIGEAPTHVYFYATPHIFVQKAPAFDPKLFQKFLAYYVSGFNDVAVFFAERSKAKTFVVYPSSVAVSERPKGMTEYAMAKAAGELLCDDLMKLHPQLRIVRPRLPRTLTDQTATIMHVDSEDPIDVVEALLRD
jgi:acyl dehydratase